jgi:tetratricopeptide (TPR) repeat protein
LDPTVPIPYLNLGVSYANLGRYDEAIVETKKAMEMNPPHPSYRRNLYWIFIWDSRYRELFDALKSYGDSESLMGQYFANLAYLRTGEKERAREFIAQNETALGAVLPSHVCFFYGFLGDADRQVLWAEKAVEARDFYMLFSYASPLNSASRADPRLKALWKRLGLVE